MEKLRQGHIHNQSHKHLERVRQTDSGLGWEQLLQRRNSKATLLPPPDPHQQISRWQAPVGTVILRRLGTGVGEGGGVLLKEVPGVSHLVSVGPVQAQIRHSMNHE